MPQVVWNSTTQPTVPAAGASATTALSALATAAGGVMIVNNGPTTIYVTVGNVATITSSLAGIPVPQTTNNPLIFGKPIGYGYIAVFLPTAGTNNGVSVCGVDNVQ